MNFGFAPALFRRFSVVAIIYLGYGVDMDRFPTRFLAGPNTRE
jgi:hypothetical protein